MRPNIRSNVRKKTMKPNLKVVPEVVPPQRRLWIGPTLGEKMHHRAMELFPESNPAGHLYLADRWIEAVEYLRSRRLWRLDRYRKTKPGVKP